MRQSPAPRAARAPRHIEALLESLGADPLFTQEVLGDLTEEYLLRARWDGEFAARRWYYREAWRTMPYLLRDWRTRLGLREAGSVFASILWSLVAAFAVDRALMAIVERFTWLVTGVPFTTWWNHWIGLGSSIPFTIFLVMTALDGYTVGYVGASVGKRAPLTNGMIVSGVVTALMLATGLHVSDKVFLVSNVMVAGMATMVGAVAACFRLRGRSTLA